jgi:hypothetical protein
MKHFIRNLALAVTAALGFAGAASAAVINCSASVTCVVGTPASGTVGNNSINENVLYAFDEQQNVLLGSALNIDVVAGSIAAGVRVASHYLAFDPPPPRTRAVEATVTFNRKILGLIITKANLDASNAVVGLSSIFYDTDRLIGLELGDTVSFSNDMTTLNWRASDPGDHIRVITASVPLPAGGLLLIGGLGALVLMRRKFAA